MLLGSIWESVISYCMNYTYITDDVEIFLIRTIMMTLTLRKILKRIINNLYKWRSNSYEFFSASSFISSIVRLNILYHKNTTEMSQELVLEIFSYLFFYCTFLVCMCASWAVLAISVCQYG